MRRLLARYENGNYTVKLFSDGTKVKSTAEDSFRASFPDSIDLKITDRCDLGCSMCHERSSPSGAEGDRSAPFLGTLAPGTELAIGGGDPLSHGGLVRFLEEMRARGVICSLTVNGEHLKKSRELVKSLLKRELVHGLGVSISHTDPEVIAFAEENKNAVLHLINGVYEDYPSLFDRGLKILILGYKRFGRGEAFYNARVADIMQKTKELLPTMVDKFACISFDNLALRQLSVDALLSDADFSRMYMGDDGEASMYIDLAGREFARSSTSTERYTLLDDVSSMFERVRVSRSEQ